MNNKITCMRCAYNEAKRVGAAIEELAPWAGEIIVFDKGSTDTHTSRRIAPSPMIRRFQPFAVVQPPEI